MDFSLSEEQLFFRDAVRAFVEREVIPCAREIDERDEFPRALFRRCGELGYFAVRYPESVGGAGGDALTFVLMIEELARGSLALAAIVGMQALNGTDLIFHLGTPEQCGTLVHFSRVERYTELVSRVKFHPLGLRRRRSHKCRPKRVNGTRCIASSALNTSDHNISQCQTVRQAGILQKLPCRSRINKCAFASSGVEERGLK